MNYSALFRNLTKEVSSASQYKRLDSPFKAFAIIATIPFWISYGALICAVYCYIFAYNCVAQSSHYLEAWMRDIKKGVNPVTEAVIYLVCLPIIFLMRVCLSGFSVAFYILWFFTMCDAYIASLAGIRWQPFISSAVFDDGIKLTPTTNKMAGHTISLIGFILFSLYVALFILSFIVDDWQTQADLMQAYTICSGIYSVFMLISVPVTFRHSITGSASAGEEPKRAAFNFDEEFPEF